MPDPYTTNVFNGTPDARQAATRVPTTRFRPTYRALTEEEKYIHDEIKRVAVELEELYSRIKPGLYSALAITALEESVMWIIKELTA